MAAKISPPGVVCSCTTLSPMPGRRSSTSITPMKNTVRNPLTADSGPTPRKPSIHARISVPAAPNGYAHSDGQSSCTR